MLINHINYKDVNGLVYCRNRDKVVKLDEEHASNFCKNCKYYAGSAQGEGVECYWDDPRKDLDNPHTVFNPEKEKDSINIAEVTSVRKSLIVTKKKLELE